MTMDSGTLTTVITTVSGVIGGVYGGVRYGKQSALGDAANSSTIATNAVEMLQVTVEHLEEMNEERERKITELNARVNLLEDLVTQRAAVAEVHDDVKLVKATVELIAKKVGIQ